MEKGRKMMIIIILLLVILLGAIVGAAIYIVGQLNQQAAESVTEFVPGGESVLQLKVDEITVYSLSTPINTNLQSEDTTSDVQRGIRASFGIGVDNRDVAAATEIVTQLTDKEVVARDIIIGILRNNSYEFFQDPASKDVISNTILVALQNAFGSNLIYKVYIGEMITS
jgi:flagellar basal body-associated protein FliL